MACCVVFDAICKNFSVAFLRPDQSIASPAATVWMADSLLPSNTAPANGMDTQLIHDQKVEPSDNLGRAFDTMMSREELYFFGCTGQLSDVAVSGAHLIKNKATRYIIVVG